MPTERPLTPSSADYADGARKELKIAVVYATCRRPGVLHATIGLLCAQTRQPDEVLVSATEEADVGLLPTLKNLRVVFGPKGLSRQRNTALTALSPDIDIVIFFDDDFLPHPRWIEATEKCFRERPAVVCLTGCLLADGVKKGGLSFDEGLDLINRYDGRFSDFLQERYSPYGCNMAFRRSSILGVAFDERLVLYGWLEDRDFAATVAKRGGKQIKTGKAIGVHMGVNRGRAPGRGLGYSQIINPLYIFGKRNMTFWQLTKHVVRNFGMNSTRCLFPENHIDRAGRFVGNLMGFLDVMRGVIEPERAERLMRAN